MLRALIIGLLLANAVTYGGLYAMWQDIGKPAAAIIPASTIIPKNGPTYKPLPKPGPTDVASAVAYWI
jgi:hypothetical protein